MSSVSFVGVGQSLVSTFKFIQLLQKSLSIYRWALEIQKSMFYLKYSFICFTFCAVNCFQRVDIGSQLSLSIPTTGGLSRPKL